MPAYHCEQAATTASTQHRLAVSPIRPRTRSTNRWVARQVWECAGPPCSLHAFCARRQQTAGGVRGPAPEGPNVSSLAAAQLPQPQRGVMFGAAWPAIAPRWGWGGESRIWRDYKHCAPLGRGTACRALAGRSPRNECKVQGPPALWHRPAAVKTGRGLPHSKTLPGPSRRLLGSWPVSRSEWNKGLLTACRSPSRGRAAAPADAGSGAGFPGSCHPPLATRSGSAAQSRPPT